MEGCCFWCMDCPLGILNTIAIQAAELRHRLSELEDKLRRGITLVELPCKVGDMVYIVGRKYRAGSYESFNQHGEIQIFGHREVRRYCIHRPRSRGSEIKGAGGKMSYGRMDGKMWNV